MQELHLVDLHNGHNIMMNRMPISILHPKEVQDIVGKMPQKEDGLKHAMKNIVWGILPKISTPQIGLIGKKKLVVFMNYGIKKIAEFLELKL